MSWSNPTPLDLGDFSGMVEDVAREAQRFCPAFASMSSPESKICKVDGCTREMIYEKAYYRRYTVCEAHLRAPQLVVDGRLQRFCQQCAKFQPIEEFDDDRRSCRTQLVKHKLRRRHKLMQQREMRRREAQRALGDGGADSGTYGVGIGCGEGASSSGSGEELHLSPHSWQSQRSTSASPGMSPTIQNLPTIRGNSSSHGGYRTTAITGRARVSDNNSRPPVTRAPSTPRMMLSRRSVPSLDGMEQLHPGADLFQRLPEAQGGGQQVATRHNLSSGNLMDMPWQQSGLREGEGAQWPPAGNVGNELRLQRPLRDGICPGSAPCYQSVSITNAMQQEEAQYSQQQHQDQQHQLLQLQHQQLQPQLQQGASKHRRSPRSTQSQLSVQEVLQRTNHSPMKISSNGTSLITQPQRPDRLLKPVPRRPSVLQPDGDLGSPMGSPCPSPRPVSCAPEELPPNLSLNSWWLNPFASNADRGMEAAIAVSADGRLDLPARPQGQGMVSDLAARDYANSQPGGRSFQPARLHPLTEVPSPTVPSGGYATAVAAAPLPLAGQPQQQQPYPAPLPMMPTLLAAPPPLGPTSHPPPPPSPAPNQQPKGSAPMQASPFRNHPVEDEGEPSRASMRHFDAPDAWMDDAFGLEPIDSLTSNYGFDLFGPQAAAKVHGMMSFNAGGSGTCPAGGGTTAPARFASAPGILCMGPSAGSGPSNSGAGAELPGDRPNSSGARPAHATEARTTTSQAFEPSSASGSGNAFAFLSGSRSGSASSGVDWRAAGGTTEKRLSAPLPSVAPTTGSAATAAMRATSWCSNDAWFYLGAPSHPSPPQSHKRLPLQWYNALPAPAPQQHHPGHTPKPPQQQQQQQPSDKLGWKMGAEDPWLQPWQPPLPPSRQVRPVASFGCSVEQPVEQPEAMMPLLRHEELPAQGAPPEQQLTGQEPQLQPYQQVNWQVAHFQEEPLSQQGVPFQPQGQPRQLPQQQLDGGQLSPPSESATPVPSATQQASTTQGVAAVADVVVAGDGGQPSAIAAAASAASGALGGGEVPYIPSVDQAPPAPVTEDGAMRRFSMKLYGVSPEDLQPDAFARLQAWVSLMDMRMMDMTVRAGCVQIIANVVTAPTGYGRAAAEYGNGCSVGSDATTATAGPLRVSNAEMPDPGLLVWDAESPQAPTRAASDLPAFSLAVGSPTPAAELSSPQQGGRLGLYGSGFGGGDVGAMVSGLLRLLFNSRVSKLGCEGSDGKRKHLVLQLDGQVACWSLSRKRPEGELPGKAIIRDADKGGSVPQKAADGLSAPPCDHISPSLDVLYGTPVTVALPLSPVVVVVHPVAVVAGQPNKQLVVTLRVPASAVDVCDAKTAAGTSTTLQLRFEGDTLVNFDLSSFLQSGSPSSQRDASIVDSAASTSHSNTITASPRPAITAATTTTTSGSNSVPTTAATASAATTITVAMPLPALTSPGMAVVETSCGDVLGPWLPLLVVPSEVVASELEGLVRRMTEGDGSAARPPTHQLRHFLCDLGRLLPLLDGTGGACSRRECIAPNGKSYVSYMAQQYDMPEAADVASRVLGRCVEWCLPECGSLVSRLLAS